MIQTLLQVAATMAVYLIVLAGFIIGAIQVKKKLPGALDYLLAGTSFTGIIMVLKHFNLINF